MITAYSETMILLKMGALQPNSVWCKISGVCRFCSLNVTENVNYISFFWITYRFINGTYFLHLFNQLLFQWRCSFWLNRCFSSLQDCRRRSVACLPISPLQAYTNSRINNNSRCMFARNKNCPNWIFTHKHTPQLLLPVFCHYNVLGSEQRTSIWPLL